MYLISMSAKKDEVHKRWRFDSRNKSITLQPMLFLEEVWIMLLDLPQKRTERLPENRKPFLEIPPD
jgi:hypothetical protein